MRDNKRMTDNNLAVIVLAAGQGTRMKSERPKVLHALAGIPIVGHVLATARELTPAHVVVVVRHERDAVAATVLELLPEAMVVDRDGTRLITSEFEPSIRRYSRDGSTILGSLPVPTALKVARNS